MGSESMKPPVERATAIASARYLAQPDPTDPHGNRRALSPPGESAMAGLPLPGLRSPRPPVAGVRYALTTTDRRGRLADRSPVSALGWAPGQPIAIAAIDDTIAIREAADSSTTLTSEGFLRLPAELRHRCHVEVGDRLLVCAYPDLGLIFICHASVLDELITPYSGEP